MNINWKIRIKNVSFWVSICISVFTPILAYMGLTAADITTWSTLGDMLLSAVSNPYILLMIAVSVYNAIIDPTTTGVTDSSQALTYDNPNNVKTVTKNE